MEQTNNKSLYERLGSAEGISVLVDQIVEEHMKNPHISARFLPYLKKPEALAVVKQHTREFFASGSGGSEIYTGKDMKTTHEGMNISPAEYMYVMDDIMIVLDRNGIDEDSRNDVLAILYSLKGMIVGV